MNSSSISEPGLSFFSSLAMICFWNSFSRSQSGIAILNDWKPRGAKEIGFEQALELDEGLVVEDHRIERVEPAAGD